MSVSFRRIYQLSRDCNSISHLKQLLTQIIQSHASNYASSLAALLSFSATSPHGDLRFASLLFTHLPNPNSFAYNCMMQGLVDARLPDQAFLLYLRMNRESLAPDNFTFPFVLKACSLLSAVSTGKAIHARILQLGFSFDPYIQSGLVRMYSEFDEVGTARHLFDGIPERDVVLWNSMIGGYVKGGNLDSARELFEEMPAKNVGTYNALIGGHVKFGCMDDASRLFEEMPERDVVSWNTMVGAHARASSVAVARELFDRAPQKNVATWSAIISGFAQSSRFVDALDMFKDMLVKGPRPDQSILVSVLSCCAHLGALEQGIWIHGYIDRQGIEVDDLLGSSLIDMYSKCGMLQGAISVFDKLQKREVCSWTSMIHGLAIYGHAHQALEAFEEMERFKIIPNAVTFIAILSACSHAGMVAKGREIFHRMHQVYGIIPTIEHYTCMVDLLSRGNHIEEARDLIKSMPMKPDVFMWGALLGGLRIHGQHGLIYEQELGREIVKLEPRDSGAYMLVSNIYASIDQWDDAVRTRRMMERFGIKKNPGCSLIEVDGEVHEFLASERSNTKSEQVYEMLDQVPTK
ncbi:pentatricopeptide repeat-containing protein At3g29230-like [Phoenix dactylifera]|uniref:Pentatricopeptide repeat-containing protein At3g29230-like n=1 Tax=Phoenix dactylifera TaxID=42345 RepID=A0A8B7CMM3_PHODC|nr:pentatricopeptide repeat-containing protein At3g29230-like [Phoenix dactylifera]